MREFARLYAALDATTQTNRKVAALAEYFGTASPSDAAWATYFLMGRRPKRPVSSTKLQQWAAELAGLPDWLFTECYDAVGDLSETITLVVGDRPAADSGRSLSEWIEHKILSLANLSEEEQKRSITEAWLALPADERFLFNKLLTGAFRVGVSKELVLRAIAQARSIPMAQVSHRATGDWSPTPTWWDSLALTDLVGDDIRQPYPICLAHAWEGDPNELGDPQDFAIEHKWDGIRAQVVRRAGECHIWTRGEELVTERYPEIVTAVANLPDGTVLDGELLAWRDGKVAPFADLQRRIGRKTVGKKLLSEVPVRLVPFDLLELGGEDFREQPFRIRRMELDRVVAGCPELSPSPLLAAATWAEVRHLREAAREANAEGLMLKGWETPYAVGRKRGIWWKWKVTPMTVDAVLIYAQRGSGRRASLYTDYTFALWDDNGSLVPFAKAYSGLTDAEIREVDAFIRRHTLEKFGPVRTVKPELVMELAFEGIQLSKRHKSGVAVRFPRIANWRRDKPPAEADRLSEIHRLLAAREGTGTA